MAAHNTSNKKSLGKNQYIKKKVRSSKEWKQLRIDIQEEYDNTDPVTLKPLRKGFAVHHLDESVENYGNLDDHSKFRPLNKTTHEILHAIYTYYRKDPKVLDRLKELLDLMVQYNEGI